MQFYLGFSYKIEDVMRVNTRRSPIAITPNRHNVNNFTASAKQAAKVKR